MMTREATETAGAAAHVAEARRWVERLRTRLHALRAKDKRLRSLLTYLDSELARAGIHLAALRGICCEGGAVGTGTFDNAVDLHEDTGGDRRAPGG